MSIGVRRKIPLYIMLLILTVIFVYPIAWLVGASFKENAEIFTSLGIFPRNFTLDGYIRGWRGVGANTFGVFFRNSFVMVVPTVLFTIASSCIVAYGFARFEFPLKRMWFIVMISTMMLPSTVLMIPRYILFNNFGMLNTYNPFYVTAILATNPFFTYLLIQFFRGIPKELDESAHIDGCSRMGIFLRIMLPLIRTPIISVALIQFMWTWNDFANPLIYITRPRLFPVALGLRLALDGESAVNWNQIIAMSVLSMLPLMVLFLFFQRYFVEGIAKSGIKG